MYRVFSSFVNHKEHSIDFHVNFGNTLQMLAKDPVRFLNNSRNISDTIK